MTTRNQGKKARSSARYGRHRIRHGRRDGGLAGKLLKGMAVLAVPALMLGGGGYGAYVYLGIEKIDARYCYERSDQPQAAVFLDASTYPNLSPAQRRDVRTALVQMYETAEPNTKFMIFDSTRDSASSIASPSFVQCRPAETEAEQLSIDAPSATPARLKTIGADARQRFLAEVESILAETLDAQKAAVESPLLASIQAISRYPGFQGRERRLLFLSDGLESSETARFGQVQGDLPRAALFVQRPAFEAVRPDPLTGMDVTVLLVESLTLPQPGLDYATHEEVRAFWRDFFTLNGASGARIQRLRRVAGS